MSRANAARGLHQEMPPPELRCPLCLGETKGDGPAVCLDYDACVKRTGRLEPIVLVEMLNARLNASRRRHGKPPIPVRHHLLNPGIRR